MSNQVFITTDEKATNGFPRDLVCQSKLLRELLEESSDNTIDFDVCEYETLHMLLTFASKIEPCDLDYSQKLEIYQKVAEERLDSEIKEWLDKIELVDFPEYYEIARILEMTRVALHIARFIAEKFAQDADPMVWYNVIDPEHRVIKHNEQVICERDGITPEEYWAELESMKYVKPEETETKS